MGVVRTAVLVCSRPFVSAKLIKARRVTDSRWVNGLHPCICADSQSGVFEVDTSSAIVVAVAVAIPATLLVSIRACVIFVADSKVGTNPNTSKDDECDWNTNFNPFR